ncbi:uncharacterized protein PV07_10437 [Cladophialophora immunda]|uniref:Transcription initiation factor IIE subunit alpha N-terminal domain-containing protein n=1 Tax=Cladophialophora immunda TaxID=569365 RepID=A0A0D2C070_9EURO|nr:uncharacterized protein PV07_10437 [Cladophialophora immunda]KIW24743.1 hypothetical protein PV07_10437 [Cladophialophora immunda]
MDEAKTLIRTAVRTFFPHPKQIIIVDAILMHSVLQIDDLNILLNSQPKDIRSLINPLRTARLVQTQSRNEAKVGSTRPSAREYYFCPFHPAIDAIKYKIAKLRKKVEAMYQQDETKRKDWRCPRCKAEYEELDILDKVGDEGFYCDRCHATLVQNEKVALKDRGNHEKIRKLNDQLKKFDDMILKIDRTDIPENDFASAWDRKKDVPRQQGSGKTDTSEQYVPLQRGNRYYDYKRGGPDMVDVKNLTVNLTSGEEQEREEAERKEERRQFLAKQNQLPVWYTSSAIGATTNGTATAATTPEEDDAGEEEEEGEGEEGEEDFEDVDVKPVNGIKREYEVAFEGDSEEDEEFEDAV